MQNFPTKLLKNWFCHNHRSLPWREEPTPYRVWVSEIMLQQTQVAVVIPYFERWMVRFPTICELAKAPLEDVLKCWEGLGYYSRARNIHTAAQDLVQNYQGELPSDAHELAKIKGIGSYTQGAIRSFAFHQKAAAVDGNVLRVLSRFFAIEEQIDKPKTKTKIQHLAENILPEEESWLVTEGLIELGATVCTKKAHCPSCPLKKECLAFRHHLQDQLPRKQKRPKIILLKRDVAVIVCNGKFLVQKNKSGEIMADLYEFLFLDHCEKSIKNRFEEVLGFPLQYLHPLPEQRHTFTRFRVQLFPHLMLCEKPMLGEGYLWKSEHELTQLPFSSGHRRVLTQVLTKY